MKPLEHLINGLHIDFKRRTRGKRTAQVPVLAVQICLAHIRPIALLAEHSGSFSHTVGVRELIPGIAFQWNLFVMNEPLKVAIYVFR